MKKIVAIAAFLSLSLSMMAQDDIRFGFQLSPSFSWMNTNTSKINPSGTNLGLKLGMTGEYYFRENYAFTSGIGFYFNNGGTLLHDFGGAYWPNSDLPSSLDSLPNNVKLKYSIQYLEIPVGLKLRTREFGYLRYFMEPAITIGLKTQARGTIEGTGVKSDEKYNIRKEVNLLNLAWGIGAGVEYGISENTSLVAGLGFQVGFTDVTDDKGQVFDPERGTQRERSKGTNNSITIRLGILF